MKPLITNTSKEFIKCRILHFLIMECCRYLVFLIKWLYVTLYNCSRIFIAIYLFSEILKFTKYSIKLIEKLSRRHLINSSDVFVIKGFTVRKLLQSYWFGFRSQHHILRIFFLLFAFLSFYSYIKHPWDTF